MIHSFGILTHILDANIIVKLVLLILAFFSLTSWAIIFYKLRYLNRAKRENKEFIDIFWESKRLDYVMSAAKNLDYSPVASMFESAYKELVSLKKMATEDKEKSLSEYDTKLNGSHLVERALKKSQLSSISKLELTLPFLATTGSTSPFIGLFGTVWGIMTSFESIQKAGTAGLAVVAPGIADSLVATAAGLFAAIPAVIAYNYYTNKVRVLVNEMDDFAYEFMTIVEKQILKD
ncbi:MAG: protein TolQ [Candidatus Acididesulfobacter guangdongensis]|uniref:Protein TolQ n=1 Tax=Acididesulfobacter guangdongensis TaxID=2597225 RepID=A0A519BH28_ACIG2|nr:MAG: protein TolQ [Candidatus Acididesulfobacter guangdongensis]